MKLREYLQLAVNAPRFNVNNINIVEKVYQTKLKRSVRNLTSCIDNAVYFDDTDARLLSFNEIASGADDFQIDFVHFGIIPYIDMGKNIMIVWSIYYQSWCFFDKIQKYAYKLNKDIFALISNCE